MKKEDKELLLKDLCARLPYGVKIALKNGGAYHHENVAKKGDVTIDRLKGFNGRYFTIYHDNPLDWDWNDDEIEVEDVKPYLFPLSSMTEEQREELKREYCNIACDNIKKMFANPDESHLYSSKSSSFEIDWFNKHHIDYRGLIEKGLAIDATGLNIY